MFYSLLFRPTGRDPEDRAQRGGTCGVRRRPHDHPGPDKPRILPEVQTENGYGVRKNSL